MKMVTQEEARGKVHEVFEKECERGDHKEVAEMFEGLEGGPHWVAYERRQRAITD